VACSVLASAASQALLRHVVASTGSAWGVWCIPPRTAHSAEPNARRWGVLWCNAQAATHLWAWSDDEIRRVFGVVLASGLPTVCNEVPASWQAGLAAGDAALAAGWRHWLGASLGEMAQARALLGLANRPGGYTLDQARAWQPVFETLAAVSAVDLQQAMPEALVARAVQTRSTFLSRMSHELRTPLNALLGFAQLLRVDASQPLSAAQRTKLDLIEQAGQHLLTLVSDVVDLTRIEAGGLSLSIEPVRVAAAVDDALAELAEAARARGVRLHTLVFEAPAHPLAAPLDAASVHVLADRLRLRQMLVNLLSNAIKYNYAGGWVRVSVRVSPPPGAGAPETVAVAVADGGPGLSAEQQSRLFEPFNRLGAERTAAPGSGIGLLIVRKLAEVMHGSLSLHSEPGAGATFTLQLPGALAAPLPDPLLADNEPALLQPDGPPATSAEASESAQPFTVLYAEDNEVNVELVRQVMRMRPLVRLLVAHSGAQAIELVRAQRPDVLLLDMHLGDMTGIDVVMALDRDPATAGIARLALSADALPDHIRAARKFGFETYLTKPLDVSALLKSLDALSAQCERLA